MKLFHVLKTSKHEIPLVSPDFLKDTSTLHDLYKGEVTNRGFLLTFGVSEDATHPEDPSKKHKYKGHKFRLLIEPDEIEGWLEALQEMKDLDARMQAIIEEEDNTVDEEAEGA